MDEAERLPALVALWWEAIDSFTHLREAVGEDQWHAPTDLPGWDVHAVVAHTAHVEALLAGGRHEDVEVGEVPHAHGMMGTFTEQGVVARRDASPDDLITEIRESATARHTALLADPPDDPTVAAPGLFGAIGWSTETLLRNRPLDVWMHEQDVRRAIDRPGNLDCAAAIYSTDYLLQSVPFVLAKRAGAPAGTTVRVEVAGHAPLTAVVGEDGRGRIADERVPDDAPGAQPSATIATDRETFVLLAGGRREAAPGAVRTSGDTDLAARMLGALAVTP